MLFESIWPLTYFKVKFHFFVLDFDLSYKMRYRKNSFRKMLISVIRNDLGNNLLIQFTRYESYLPLKPKKWNFMLVWYIWYSVMTWGYVFWSVRPLT